EVSGLPGPVIRRGRSALETSGWNPSTSGVPTMQNPVVSAIAGFGLLATAGFTATFDAHQARSHAQMSRVIPRLERCAVGQDARHAKHACSLAADMAVPGSGSGS